MSFWELRQPEGRTALIEDDQAVTYGALGELSSRFAAAQTTRTGKALGVVIGQNRLGAVAAYLGALQRGDATILLPGTLDPTLLRSQLERYRPDWIAAPEAMALPVRSDAGESLAGYRIHRSLESASTPLHPELALLLPTSGSTGSSRLVRLTFGNVQANAHSIAQYLGLDENERAITTLPLHYSYGLSVINSHLLVGASIVLTDESVLARGFWSLFQRQAPTSMAGVPYTYQMLERLRFASMQLPSLRTLTQAGGRLEPRLVSQFHALSQQQRWRFFVMYGQTEATARMSYVPPEQLAAKTASVGIAIPDGRLEIASDTSELIYSGPNVMLGYAETPADLAKGDELGGVLRTGDVGTQDGDGFFFVTGRLRRFIKLTGLRINLDEVEGLLSAHVGASVAATGTDSSLLIALVEGTDVGLAREWLTQRLGLHQTLFKVKTVPELPRLSNGKLDYETLRQAP